MPELTQTCRITGKEFVVTEWEQDFLQKFGLPLPTLCIEERHRRRLSHRNERKIYNAKCDLTGEPIVSLYSPGGPCTVYSQDAWWSDKWDAKDYGCDYDFSKPFFQQFHELRQVVPRLSLMNSQGENSEYCNMSLSNKNCYLVFGGDYSEDCMYSIFCMYCKDNVDVYWVNESELVYDSTDCTKCYNLKYCQNSHNCKDSSFLFECRNCDDCFGCVGLRSKRYHIFNKLYSKEDYERKVKGYRLDSWTAVEKMKKEFAEFKLKYPHKFASTVNCEGCTGDYLSNANNVSNSFGIEGPAEDMKDVFLGGWVAKDILSSDHVGHKPELFYEMTGSVDGYHNALSACSWWSNDVFYCDLVSNGHDLFGCVCLNRGEYCILNKQYSKDEYFDLRARIVEHMKSTGEWGEFCPMKDSLFAYNETVAQDYFPMTKSEALSQGLKWLDEEVREMQSDYVIPDSINDVSDDIVGKPLVCEKTGRPYKIIPRELELYKKMGVPIPHYAPETRNALRLAMRNPIISFDRSCAKCAAKVVTSYAPERREIVYCDKCYLETVY